MRSEALVGLIVILVIASLGAGYLAGTGVRQTGTLTATVSSTAMITTQSNSTVTSTTTLVETSSVHCGAFHSVPVGPATYSNFTNTGNFTSTLPALVIPYSGATFCVRLTYIVTNPQLAKNFPNGTLGNSIGIGDYGPGGEFENDNSSFQLSVIPPSENLTEIPQNSTFTVDYLVEPVPGTTGFLDRSFQGFSGCYYLPLAVGYSAAEVNASDFSRAVGDLAYAFLLASIYSHWKSRRLPPMST